MRATAMRRTLMMCLAIPLLVGVATAAEAIAYVCRTDSVVRFQCCCPAQEALHDVPDPIVALEKACCCDIVRQPIAPATSRLETVAGDAGKLSAEAAAVGTTSSGLAGTRAPSRRAEQTASPIPILLQKHSLLL